MRKIFHLVSSNGLGHFKRTIEIWEELIQNLDVQVTIACEEWQFNRFLNHRNLYSLKRNANISFYFIDLSNTLGWGESKKLSFSHYKLSLLKIKELQFYKSADLVISDNLLGVIASDKKVLILGSFLWHDVLRNSSGGVIDEEIYNYESYLLKNSTSKFVSVKDVTMPTLQALNENQGLPWFCKDVYDRPAEVKDQYKVLFSAGLSGADTSALTELISEFKKDPKYSIYLSPALIANADLDDHNFVVFDFEESSFKSIDLMIARPGVGALTEAIKYQIPTLAIDNGDNSDMLFNAMRLQQLGYGWDGISRIPNLQELEQEYHSKLQALKTCRVNGFKDLEKIIKESLRI